MCVPSVDTHTRSWPRNSMAAPARVLHTRESWVGIRPTVDIGLEQHVSSGGMTRSNRASVLIGRSSSLRTRVCTHVLPRASRNLMGIGPMVMGLALHSTGTTSTLSFARTSRMQPLHPSTVVSHALGHSWAWHLIIGNEKRDHVCWFTLCGHHGVLVCTLHGALSAREFRIARVLRTRCEGATASA